MSNVSSRPAPTSALSVLTALSMVFLAIIALPFLVQLGMVLVPGLLGVPEAQVDNWITTPLAMFVYALVADVLSLYILLKVARNRHLAFRQVAGLGRFSWRHLGYVIGGFLVYFILFIVLLSVINQIVAVDTSQEQAIGFNKDVTGLGLIMAFISLVVMPPIIEEILFRGVLYGSLRAEKASVAVATLSTSLVFSSLHLFGGADGQLLWIAMIDTFALSLVLCYVREKTGSVWAGMGIHALKNGFVFVNLFFLASL